MPTDGRDGAAPLLRDVVLQLVVILAKPLDLLQEHPTFFAGLLEDLRGGGLRALADLVRGAQGAGERFLGGGVVLLVNGCAALGGLKVSLKLRDALGELRHP